MNAANDPVHAVVHVGEVEYLVLAVHGNRLVRGYLLVEERNHALHALSIIVVAAIDVRKRKTM